MGTFEYTSDDLVGTDAAPWWTEEHPAPGPALWRHLQGVELKQHEHHQRLLWHACLYSNREVTAFDFGWGSTTHTNLIAHRQGTDDLIYPVVEAHAASVGKNRVKARPKTKMAGFKLRRASRKLDRYLYAEAKRLDFWERHARAFEDACWGEVGAIKWGFDDLGVTAERVFPDELIIDNDECYAEPLPLTVGRRKAVHVDSILKAWDLSPEDKEALRAEARRAVEFGWVHERTPGPGWVIVTEGHRRACGGKGRHVIGTHTLTLLDEPWDHDWFPYTFFHYTNPTSGFYCKSAVERALGWQRRLDELNAAIRDTQDICSRPRLWSRLGAKLDVKDLTNRIGKVIQSAEKPEPLVWPTNLADLYAERQRCKDECYADFGISPLTSQGKLPNQTRLDSSKAINEYAQIQDDRLSRLAQRYERFQMQGYEMILRMSELAHSAGKTPKTTWVAGKRVEEINWADIDYEKDRFVLQLEPASTMSESTAQLKDDAAKLVQSGVITPEEFLALDANPDMEKLVSLKVKSTENIFRKIEVIEDGGYEPPSPMDNLDVGVMLFHYHHCELEVEYDDVPQAVKDNLTLWILQAKWILSQGQDFSGMGSEVESAGAPVAPGMGTQVPGMGTMPTGLPGDPMALPAAPPGDPMAAAQIPSLSPSAGQL